MLKIVSFLFLLLIILQNGYSADVRSSLSPNSANVGDELVLSIEVQGAQGKAIQFPPPPGNGFEVLSLDTSAVSKNGIMKYHLAVFDTGTYSVPALPVILRSKAAAETLYTSKLSAKIISNLPDSASAIIPNKPYRKHPFQWRELLTYVWIPIVLLVGVLGWWIWKRFFKRGTEEELAPEFRIPAHELAIRELIALKDKKYPSRGMLKEFFTEYSEIMRRYLERRYKFPALEMTTFDLEREVEESNLPDKLLQRLLPSLREADLVKFAKYLPPFDSCDRYVELGFEIVDLTRERVEETNVETKAA